MNTSAATPPPASGTSLVHSRSLRFLEYSVHDLSMEEAVTCILQFAREPGLHHVVVLNANKTFLAARDRRLAEIVRGAHLVVPEYAVVWGSRVLGTPLRASIRGVELAQNLLLRLEEAQLPIYFFGARPEVVSRMTERLRRQHPRLVIAGGRSGYYQPHEESSIIEAIKAVHPAILLVALGSPRQEFWIGRWAKELEVPVAIGVGGSFDVLAGIKRDAPPWTRRGGEWIFRLSQDPRNLWKRYLTTNPWFVYRVLKEKLNRRERRGRPLG